MVISHCINYIYKPSIGLLLSMARPINRYLPIISTNNARNSHATHL